MRNAMLDVLVDEIALMDERGKMVEDTFTLLERLKEIRAKLDSEACVPVVKIEVVRGVAIVAEKPKGVRLIILDRDNMHDDGPATYPETISVREG